LQLLIGDLGITRERKVCGDPGLGGREADP